MRRAWGTCLRPFFEVAQIRAPPKNDHFECSCANRCISGTSGPGEPRFQNSAGDKAIYVHAKNQVRSAALRGARARDPQIPYSPGPN